MAKSKKKTKLSAFSRFSKQQLIVAAIFILGFGGFGVWKLAFSSAATYPPSELTKTVVTSTPETGGSDIYCLNAKIDTGYGPLAFNCVMKSGDTSVNPYPTKVGTYSSITRKFNTTLDSTPRTSESIIRLTNQTCTNLSNTYFSGKGIIKTGYGPLSYGYVYLWYGKWLIKPATFYRTGSGQGTCHPSGDWKEAKPW